jgi:uncharacterized membrane protein
MACYFTNLLQSQMLQRTMPTSSNNQTYFVITANLLSFINAATFKHKNAADISWASDIKSARTVAKILTGQQVSMKTAKKVWSMCVAEGYKNIFEIAFEEVN